MTWHSMPHHRYNVIFPVEKGWAVGTGDGEWVEGNWHTHLHQCGQWWCDAPSPSRWCGMDIGVVVRCVVVSGWHQWWVMWVVSDGSGWWWLGYHVVIRWGCWALCACVQLVRWLVMVAVVWLVPVTWRPHVVIVRVGVCCVVMAGRSWWWVMVAFGSSGEVVRWWHGVVVVDNGGYDGSCEKKSVGDCWRHQIERRHLPILNLGVFGINVITDDHSGGWFLMHSIPGHSS